MGMPGEFIGAGAEMAGGVFEGVGAAVPEIPSGGGIGDIGADAGPDLGGDAGADIGTGIDDLGGDADARTAATFDEPDDVAGHGGETSDIGGDADEIIPPAEDGESPFDTYDRQPEGPEAAPEAQVADAEPVDLSGDDDAGEPVADVDADAPDELPDEAQEDVPDDIPTYAETTTGDANQELGDDVESDDDPNDVPVDSTGEEPDVQDNEGAIPDDDALDGTVVLPPGDAGTGLMPAEDFVDDALIPGGVLHGADTPMDALTGETGSEAGGITDGTDDLLGEAGEGAGADGDRHGPEADEADAESIGDNLVPTDENLTDRVPDVGPGPVDSEGGEPAAQQLETADPAAQPETDADSTDLPLADPAEPEKEPELTPHQNSLAGMQSNLDEMKLRLEVMLAEKEADLKLPVAGDTPTTDAGSDASPGTENGGTTPEENADIDAGAIHVNATDVDDAAMLNEFGISTKNADVKELAIGGPDGKTAQTVWDQIKARADLAGKSVISKIENGTVERLKLFDDDQVRVELVKVITDQAKNERLFIRAGIPEDKIPKEFRTRHIGNAAHAGMIKARTDGRQGLREQMGAVGFKVFKEHLGAAIREHRLGKMVVKGEAGQRAEATMARMQDRRDNLIKQGKLKPGDIEGKNRGVIKHPAGNAHNRHSKESIKSMRRFGETREQHAKRVERANRSRTTNQPDGNRRPPKSGGGKTRPVDKARRAVHHANQFHKNNVSHNKVASDVRKLEAKLRELQTAKKVPDRGRQIRETRAHLKAARQERFATSFTGRLLSHTLDAISA